MISFADDKVETEETNEITAVEELEEKRTADSKHFLMSDQTVKAIIYNEPVHYLENGTWKDIDNTLEYEKAAESDDVNGYKTKSGPFDVKFAKKANSSKLVTIKQDKYSLSWDLKNKSKVSSLMNNAEIVKQKTSNDDVIEASVANTSQIVNYNNITDNTDLQYVVNGNGLKENIIVNDKSDEYKYSFEIKAVNLTLELQEDNSIIASAGDTGEIIYKIPSMYMIDKSGAYSDDVSVSLSQKNKNKYTIEITANSQWINSEERLFPVIIDPQITTQQIKKNIYSTYVESGHSTTNHNGEIQMMVGKDSSGAGKCRGFVKFTLPSLNKGDMVIDATMYLVQHYADYYASTTPDAQVNAYMVSQAWQEGTVTWANQPSYTSVALDYDFIKKSDTKAMWKEWNITKAVKQWYEGTSSNYGIMLRSTLENVSALADSCIYAYYYTESGATSTAYPMIAISYRNNKGIESYWTYTTASVGSAGTASVNDYTGNLVYELPILSSNSEIAPLTLTGIFNNYCANEKYVTGKNYSARTTIGRGFRLNIQQTVLPSSLYGLSGDAAKNYPYVYTDGDGTEHYMKKETENNKTVYKDEDGLGIKLSLEPDKTATYQITDKAGNDYYFNIKGNLGFWEDTNGNRVTVTYKGASTADNIETRTRISHITDGAGHNYNLTYYTASDGTESDYIKTITDNAGRVITFTTSLGLLREIRYSDGTKTQIKYKFESDNNEGSEGLIDYIVSSDGYQIGFNYTSKALGRRVKTIKENGATNKNHTAFSAGQIITFDRSSYNTTVIRSAGLDGYHYTENSSKGNDDIITTLQFDNMGRTVSQQIKYGSGEEISANSYNYTTSATDKSTLGSKNKIDVNGAVGKNVTNLLNGGNAESASDWAQVTANSNGYSAEEYVTSNTVYMGRLSMAIHNSSVGTGDGNSYYRQITYNVNPGKKYTLSAYVRTHNVNPKSSAALCGAYLQLAAYGVNSSGASVHKGSAYSETLTSTTDPQINNGWRRISTTITAPSDTKQLRVYLCLRNATGYAYYDSIQLEEAASENDYNMLENSSFENYSSGLPTKWTALNTEYTTNSSGGVVNGVTPDYKKSGKYSVRINGEANRAKGFSQTIAISDSTEDTYILSGWAYGYPINSTFYTRNNKNTALFEIAVKVNYDCYDKSTGKTTSVSQYKNSAKFNASITGWQYSSSTIVVKYKNPQSGKTYTPKSILVVPRFAYQTNFACFDNLMLAKEPALSYTYDGKGNVVSVSANAEQKSDMTYDGNDIKTYTDAAGFKVSFNYDSNHNLTSSVSARGLTSAYTYDSKGNVTSTELKSSDGKQSVKTEKTYTDANSANGINKGAYLKSEIDQNGNAATYTRDWATGTVKSVTDANGTNTDSAYYGTYEKLKSVTSGSSTVTYKYDSDNSYSSNRLSSIKISGTESGAPSENYSFAYDYFGNTTSTSVGSTVLASNSYNAKNGALNTVTYGNGDKKNYKYDTLGNITALYKNSESSPSYSWQYSAGGTPLSHTDNINDLKYSYTYDSIDRFIRQRITTVGGADVGATEFGYDERNNIKKIVNQIGGRTYTQNYSYAQVSENSNSSSYTKDNLPTLYKLSSDKYAVYSYDSLNRLSQRKFSTTSPLYNDYIYKLSQRNGSGESKYQTTLLGTEFIVNDSYSYTYDKAGNITEITKGVRKSTDASSGDFKKADNESVYRSYEYDVLGQLTRENDKATDISKTYSYDSLGNILSVSEYPYSTEALETPSKTVAYTYGKDGKNGWNNLLVGVDSDGDGTLGDTETITYDAIGNPTTYLGSTLSWNARELKGYKDETNNISYTYDSDGLRASKTVNGARTIYQYVNSALYYQCTYTKSGAIDKEMYFFYDSYGNLASVRCFTGGKEYVYYTATNMQGDVLGIYDSSGTNVASYEYDTWGNIISTTDTSPIGIAELNPIRYRGYYYDSETELYYLQSRYYDSQIGRFLNADGYVSTGQDILGYNMFVYCGNNSETNTDPTGTCYFNARGQWCHDNWESLNGYKKKAAPNSNVGSAKPYVYMPGSGNLSSPNCYAYAIGSSTNEQPGKASGRVPTRWNDVYDVGASVEADLKAKGYSVRQISGPNVKVFNNEFKIALRVGTNPYYFDSFTGISYYDYHFMRQTDTGQWAEKHGTGGESILWDSGMTPDTIPWTLNDMEYYDSSIIYYAVGN